MNCASMKLLWIKNRNRLLFCFVFAKFVLYTIVWLAKTDGGGWSDRQMDGWMDERTPDVEHKIRMCSCVRCLCGWWWGCCLPSSGWGQQQLRIFHFRFIWLPTFNSQSGCERSKQPASQPANQSIKAASADDHGDDDDDGSRKCAHLIKNLIVDNKFKYHF